MPSHTTIPNLNGGDRNPITAAALSLVPGLGQLYNGEARKGVLFFDVSAIHCFFLWMIFCTNPILDSIKRFGAMYRIQPNGELLHAVRQMHFGTPCATIILMLIVAYIAYAMRDAYDAALRTRLRAIYADAVLNLPEATSGSYLLHIAFLMACTIIGIFFVLPPPQQKQVTVIEFVNSKPAIKPTESKTLANQNTVATGQHRNDAPITPSHSEPSPPRPRMETPRNASQPKTASHVESKSEPNHPTQPSTAPPSPPQLHFAPHAATNVPVTFAPPSVMPLPTPTHVIGSTAPVIRPHAEVPNNIPSPLPPANTARSLPNSPGPLAAASSHASSSTPGPKPLSQGTSSTSSPAPPGPVAATTAHDGPNIPTLPSAHTGPSTSHTDLPTPSHVPSSIAGNKDLLAIKPHLPPSTATDGPPITSSPARTDDPRTDIDRHKCPSPVDFSAYMAGLQRRIKTAWIPPKNDASKRVVLSFTVSVTGELSNLKLRRSSGSGPADQAAMRAVEQAAPFAHLPRGADEPVDIEFTFDYNVFSGSAKAVNF